MTSAGSFSSALTGVLRSRVFFGEKLLEEAIGEFPLDLNKGRGFVASGFGCKSFALLPRPLLRLCSTLDLLLPAEVSDHSQHDDAHGGYSEKRASHPSAFNAHVLNLIGEPFHLELQAANLLIEVLGRLGGKVQPVARRQAHAVSLL